jgi:hypothetical protein
MKDPEKAIEKVLAGLRNADAPIGMERRILEKLQDQAPAGARSGGRRRWRPVWLVMPVRPVGSRFMAWGIVLAGVFAVVFAIPAIRRLGHVSVMPKTISSAASPVRPATSEVAVKRAQPLKLRSEARWMKVSARRAEVASDSESLALEEMHAASQPPPPMPLTEQERLLLRIAHKGDPVELAMLDPKLQAIRDLEERAEFQSFFGKSAMQAAPAQSMREQVAPQQKSATEQTTPAQLTVEPSTAEQHVEEQPTPEKRTPGPSNIQQPTPQQ